jgi:DsbC/DsbD-like thiol-disulfide interchange protein
MATERFFENGKVVERKPTEAELAQRALDNALPLVPLDEVDARRRSEYVAVTDPLLIEFLAEKFANDPQAKTWLDARKAVKVKHPKPTEGKKNVQS